MGFGEILREFGVKVNLGFDGKAVDKAQDKIEKFAVKLRTFALEAAGVTAGLLAIQDGFTSNARSLVDQAAMLGISTDALQEYEGAAKILGDVNRDELVGSFQKLADTMDQARAGVPEATKTLYDLGTASGNSMMYLNRLNDSSYKVTDAFHDMANGIQAISKNSPQAASRIAEQVFGSAKMVNVLRGGSKALDENIEWSKKNFVQNEKALAMGKAMDVQMTKLWLVMRNFGYEIGFKVMTHLGPMIMQFEKWFKANKNLIASGITAFLKTLADVVKVIWEDFIKLTTALGPVIDYLGGTQRAVNDLIGVWIVYKGLQIASSFIDMASAVIRVVPFLGTFGTALLGVGKSMKAFTLISGMADVVPGLQLFAEGAIVALTPLLPILLALGAAGIALHEIMAAMKGEDGWGTKALDFATGRGWDPDSGKKPFDPKAASVFGSAKADPRMQGMIAPGQDIPNTNNFSTVNNITVPHGTTSHDASHMISRATEQSNANMLRKAKADSIVKKVR